MNISVLLAHTLVALACLTIILLLCTLLVQIAQNIKFLRHYRKNLRQRANGLRIKKMLLCLGMNTRTYLRRALWPDVVVHLNRCQQCATTAECDVALANGDISRAEDFCPNSKELIRLSRQRKNWEEQSWAKAIAYSGSPRGCPSPCAASRDKRDASLAGNGTCVDTASGQPR